MVEASLPRKTKQKPLGPQEGTGVGMRVPVPRKPRAQQHGCLAGKQPHPGAARGLAEPATWQLPRLMHVPQRCQPWAAWDSQTPQPLGRRLQRCDRLHVPISAPS